MIIWTLHYDEYIMLLLIITSNVIYMKYCLKRPHVIFFVSKVLHLGSKAEQAEYKPCIEVEN